MRQYDICVPCLQPPHPQAEVIQFRPKTKSEVMIVLGGYGSSKSRSGVEWMLQMSLLNLGRIGMEVAPSYPMLRDILIELWRERLTEYGVNFDKCYLKSDKELKLPWGSRIWFRSADNPSSLVGKNIAYGRADEDIGLPAIKVLFDRIRDPQASCLAMAITTTPDLGCLDDVLALWPQAKVFNMSSLDNYKLPAEVRLGLLQSYSGVEAECYVLGKAVRLSGRVFHQFDDVANTTDRGWNKDIPYFCCVDFGARHPVVLFGQEHKDVSIIFDEYAPLTGHHLVDLEMEPQLLKYGRPSAVYCDPAGGSVNDQSYLSSISYLRSKGFNCVYTFAPMLRAIPLGIQLLNGLFCNAQGTRKLLINKGCEITIRDIKAARYPKEGLANIKDEPIKDGIHDHTRDALRYWVINRFGTEWMKARLRK